MKYTVRSPILDVLTEHGKRTLSRKLSRAARLVFWIVIPVFVAGFIIGDVHGIRHARIETFTAGYDAAMNHVRTTIEAKMPELRAFYMADLGIKFIPRGANIAGIKYVEDSSKFNVRSARPRSAGAKDNTSEVLTLNLEPRTLNRSQAVSP